jgi:hypothetical protein
MWPRALISSYTRWLGMDDDRAPQTRAVLPPRPSARSRFSQGTFARTHGNGRDAPIPVVRLTRRHQYRRLTDAPLIVPIDNLWWPVSITV